MRNAKGILFYQINHFKASSKKQQSCSRHSFRGLAFEWAKQDLEFCPISGTPCVFAALAGPTTESLHRNRRDQGCSPVKILNFSGLSFATAQVAKLNSEDHQDWNCFHPQFTYSFMYELHRFRRSFLFLEFIILFLKEGDVTYQHI